MLGETGAAITEATEGVGGEQAQPVQSATTPAASVNAQVNPATPKSDPEARIRALQSAWEKAKAERDQLTIEKANLLSQMEAVTTKSSSELAASAEATRSSLARSQQLEGENATLKSKLARLDYVLQRPHLMPYLPLLPETDDVQKLAAADEAITKARNEDIDRINERVRTGGAVPPATPSRLSTTITADDIKRQLSEAREAGDSKRFNDLVKEFASKIPKN